MTGNRAAAALLLLCWSACARPPSPPSAGVSPHSPTPPAPPASGAQGNVEPTATPDDPFRSAAPAPAVMGSWSPPPIDSWTMANGVRVLFVERHDLPVVGVRIVSSVGAGDFPSVRPGAVAFMGAMLEQGAGKQDALELSDAYEALGADHGAFCEWDACVARVKVLSSGLGPALDLLANVVRRPTLADAEIERMRKRWLASLQQEKSSPPSMEQNALAAALYGRANPYGHALRGTPSDVTFLKRDELERAWRRSLQPKSTTIAVAGDVASGDLRALLDARFGDWSAAGAVPDPATAPTVRSASSQGVVRSLAPLERADAGARVVLVDVPGAAQSQVLVAHEGVPFGSPDRIPLGVMNAILGGMFSSRINLDLREAHAYTYGAHSRFSMRHRAGPFAAGGAIFTAHTGEAVRALLAQIARIRDEAVAPEELADAKENAKLALPARFEGVDDVAGALQELAVYALPLDEYARRSARIDAVTADDVQRVARKWLHPDAAWVVVTGDRSKVEKDLSSVGPIEHRDAYGDPVK